MYYKKNMSTKIDWTKIETEYVTQNISQIKLSKKYKISRSTIQDRCKKGDWTSKREKYHTEIARKSVQKAVEKDSEFYAELNKVCDEAAMALAIRIRDMSKQAPDLRSSDVANLSAALERIRAMLPDAAAEPDKEGGGVIIMPARDDGE